MPILLVVRHGRSTANTSGVLAGRAPGVELDAHGTAQAEALPDRLAGLPLAAAVRSPVLRCRRTLEPLLARRPELADIVDERISECDYGDWTGRKLSELMDEPLMATVQQHPTAAAFPGGESMREMQRRAVAAVYDWNERIAREHGPDAVYLMCTHGDVVKSIVADALGLHLDLFQRITAEPGSVTAIRYTPLRPFLLRLGDTGDLSSLAGRAADAPDGGTAPHGGTVPAGGADGSGQAVVGGGA
ncbi:MSMEG_4193 family putative phosphomutase [Streptomyces durbertensis]|uniref:MSMEG_4193 family putative phosphomutase n=1 Tax=Streptomyces durbertensis TaxID=2448886 RepID=A0ABR6E9Y2_9ACTN|nr:histidine phosphatase family protein [Streptomyces durbertensis]MBB1242146.1 MSMEG_4193 family putative phosphomutase [Streptomyces durbertensis]